MFTLKSITAEAIPAALEKARQYRLLNDPVDAESICRDILAVQPDHQEALETLLLSLTDKFTRSGIYPSFDQAREIAQQLDASRCRAYFAGIVYERRAKYHLNQAGPGAGPAAHRWLMQAMESFEQAIAEGGTKGQQAVLRWNSCARLMNDNPDIHDDEGDWQQPLLDPFETPH